MGIPLSAYNEKHIKNQHKIKLVISLEYFTATLFAIYINSLQCFISFCPDSTKLNPVNKWPHWIYDIVYVPTIYVHVM